MNESISNPQPTNNPTADVVICGAGIAGISAAIGALAGYGLMASLAAGELLAAHVGGTALPAYAPYFHPDRYARPEYQKLLTDIADANQL